MASRIAAHRAEIVFDIASGTADIPLRVLRYLKRQDNDRVDGTQRIIVADICPQMLAVAREKPGGDDPKLEYGLHDAHDLADVPSNSIDLYSISFGMKICDHRQVLAEAMRVLKPGGYFYCIEASRIPVGWVHKAYLNYMRWCLPAIGWLAAKGDRSAYGYLLRGIQEFPGQQEFAEEIGRHGFADVEFENLTFGIVAIHRAVKPVRSG